MRIRCELGRTFQEYQFMEHKGQLITGMTSFYIVYTVHVLKLKKGKENNDKCSVFMKVRPLIGRRIVPVDGYM